MFKKKYRIREKLNISALLEFRYSIQVKYKLIPFLWFTVKEQDNLKEIKYWYEKYLNRELLTLEESDWI